MAFPNKVVMAQIQVTSEYEGTTTAQMILRAIMAPWCPIGVSHYSKNCNAKLVSQREVLLLYLWFSFANYVYVVQTT